MGTIGSMIAANARMTFAYADQLLGGVTAERFARQPLGASGVVNTNHPAWIYGHLALYPSKMLPILGADASAVMPPNTYGALFEQKVSVCLDDPEGSVYPAMDEIVGLYRRGHDAFIGAVESAADSLLSQENPDEARRPRFPTIGGMMEFMLVGHAMLHFGQMSAWRRCEGLGPAV